ncbi:MAG: SDR family oxidoreductase, partial [Chrysiogenetes bacterium]|nr:SDR family oxidoreductase [Chrysiogenetes bacterium]
MLKNQVILITGCSSGIGRALSLELAARGHRVYASARRPEALEDLKSKGIDAVALDVNDGESIKAAVHLIHEDAGRIDMVVNNAGFSLVGPLAEVDLADFRRELETNVVGPVALAQAAIPHMVKQGSGRIVNVGSTVGILPTPFAGAYCASKSAIHMLSEVMRIELAPFGIDVILVAP